MLIRASNAITGMAGMPDPVLGDVATPEEPALVLVTAAPSAAAPLLSDTAALPIVLLVVLFVVL